jgi:hypothetical protein
MTRKMLQPLLDAGRLRSFQGLASGRKWYHSGLLLSKFLDQSTCFGETWNIAAGFYV